jgi:hypothetical protein
MHQKRSILFLIMIALGLVVGLIYGWIINPIKAAQVTPASLRADYKADYVLMVAEIYHADSNLEQAVSRLGMLGSQPPGQIAAEGLLTARSLGYAPADLALMENLYQALQMDTKTRQTQVEP